MKERENKINKAYKTSAGYESYLLGNQPTRKSVLITYAILISLIIFNIIIASSAMLFGLESQVSYATKSNIIVSILTLGLIAVPSLLREKFNIKIGDGVEILYIVYVYCALVLGFGHNFYVVVDMYDKLLHTASGALFALMVFDFFEIYSVKNEEKSVAMSPFIISAFAFQFQQLCL